MIALVFLLIVVVLLAVFAVARIRSGSGELQPPEGWYGYHPESNVTRWSLDDDSDETP